MKHAGIMGRLLGYISIVVNLMLGVFCLGLGLVGRFAGHDMDIDLLPFEPENASTVLIAAGLFALVAVFMAFSKSGFARSLLLIWSLAVTGVLIAAFFRASYRFDGMDGFQSYGAYLAISLLALLGSGLHCCRTCRRRGR